MILRLAICCHLAMSAIVARASKTPLIERPKPLWNSPTAQSNRLAHCGVQGESSMASSFPVAWRARVAVAFLALTFAADALAQDAAQRPPQQPSAAAPAGQRPGAAQGRADAATPPAAAEQHRLPPESTTKQTVVLPGRTLAF